MFFSTFYDQCLVVATWTNPSNIMFLPKKFHSISSKLKLVLTPTLSQETNTAPIYYPSPNVSRPASQLTEEEQVSTVVDQPKGSTFVRYSPGPVPRANYRAQFMNKKYFHKKFNVFHSAWNAQKSENIFLPFMTWRGVPSGNDYRRIITI